MRLVLLPPRLLGAALAIIGKLEPGDAVLEENDDDSITVHVFGEHFATGPFDRVIGRVAQAMWMHGSTHSSLVMDW